MRTFPKNDRKKFFLEMVFFFRRRENRENVVIVVKLTGSANGLFENCGLASLLFQTLFKNRFFKK